ncbi:hypothetical protein [Streptomyces sp. R527F]|uniref:hypothetical protein n=1 Tax=Streptomyces sp. R527F TaxID=1664033 RepID=UPI001F17F72C|nr:hypothetical protein [Streptomyces sp. R527F]UIZ17241.1 hypothetical protein LZ559_35040 [Streptomyces sp. R527F]
MNWWHRAHSTPLAVTVLTATMLAVPLFGGSAVPIPSLLAGMSAGIPVARNFVGYLGIGLIVQQLLGHLYGPLAVTLVPVLCALIGLAPGGRPYPWAWPLHQAPSVIAATASLLLITSGIAAASFFTPRGAARRAST